MKLIAILLMTTTLSGCALFGGGAGNEKPTAVQQNYVTKSAPAELYEIPKYPEITITETTTQADIAKWITQLEERALELENKIKQLYDYFESTPTLKPAPDKK